MPPVDNYACELTTRVNFVFVILYRLSQHNITELILITMTQPTPSAEPSTKPTGKVSPTVKPTMTVSPKPTAEVSPTP
jgi:hypothetical protein